MVVVLSFSCCGCTCEHVVDVFLFFYVDGVDVTMDMTITACRPPPKTPPAQRLRRALGAAVFNR